MVSRNSLVFTDFIDGVGNVVPVHGSFRWGSVDMSLGRAVLQELSNQKKEGLVDVKGLLSNGCLKDCERERDPKSLGVGKVTGG